MIYNYDISVISGFIKDYFNDSVRLCSFEIKFDEGVFIVDGYVEVVIEEMSGDYYTPPYSRPIGMYSDIESVGICFNDGAYHELSNEELIKIDEMIRQ